MIIRTIRLHNVGVYQGDQVIHPSTATDMPITLIGGMNGSGKTTLREAVLLALYGSRSPCVYRSGLSYTRYLKGISSRHASKDSTSYVELDFEVNADNSRDLITLRRSWNTGRRRRITDSLDVHRNGSPDAFLSEVWDSYIEEVAPRGIAELFFFDGENIFIAAESDDTPESLKLAMQELLGITAIKKTIDSLNRAISRKTRSISDERTRVLLVTLEDQKRKLLEQMSRITQELDEVDSELQLTEEDFLNAKNSYLHLRGQVIKTRKGVQERQVEVSEQLAQLKVGMIELAAGPLPLLLLPSELERLNERLIAEEKVRAARSALSILRHNNEELSSMMEEFVSQYDSGSTIKRRINQFLEDQERRIEDEARSTCFFPVSSRGTAQLANLLNSRQNELIVLAEDLLSSRSMLVEDYTRNRGYLSIETDDKQVDAILHAIDELNKKIGRLKEKRENLIDEQGSLEKRLNEVNEQLFRLGEKIALDEETARIIRFAQRSKSALLQFMQKVTEQKVTELAQNIKTAFNQLVNGSEVAEIEIDPVSLMVKLIDINGSGIDKSSLSSGERQMLALSILWGLAKSAGRELPIIIDTPMSRLDSSHRSSFINNYLLNAGKQVIVLSTDTEIVGEYHDFIKPYVGRHYLLCHELNSHRTEIRDGYFEVQVVSDDC